VRRNNSRRKDQACGGRFARSQRCGGAQKAKKPTAKEERLRREPQFKFSIKGERRKKQKLLQSRRQRADHPKGRKRAVDDLSRWYALPSWLALTAAIYIRRR
jgi:hypothetical protein